jgi:AcrR family transcriptional regulator
MSQAAQVRGEEARAAPDRLLEAAERLFLERGYDGVSVRELTEAAGVNVASVNYYYGGKQGLFVESLRMWFRKAAVRRITALKQGAGSGARPDLRGALRQYLDVTFREMLSCKKTGQILKIADNESTAYRVMVDVIIEEMARPLREALGGMIRVAEPSVTDERVVLCLTSIMGQVLHFVQGREFIERMTGRTYDEAFMAAMLDHMADFSFRGIGIAAPRADNT